jgi:hypothetical protein
LFSTCFICAKCLNEDAEWCSVLHDSAPDTRTGFRIYLIVSVVAFLFAGLYVWWVFYSRRQANQEILDRAAEKQRAQAQQSFEAMGGNRFDILDYVANPVTIRAGEQSSLCYSVSNAKTVSIDPQTDEPVWPAFSRCVHVSPRKATKYTLTIDDSLRLRMND